MGPLLHELAKKYKNVKLYPEVKSDQFEQLKSQMDVYLDINLHNSTSEVVKEISLLNKPMLAFYTSQMGIMASICIQVSIQKGFFKHSIH